MRELGQDPSRSRLPLNRKGSNLVPNHRPALVPSASAQEAEGGRPRACSGAVPETRCTVSTSQAVWRCCGFFPTAGFRFWFSSRCSPGTSTRPTLPRRRGRLVLRNPARTGSAPSPMPWSACARHLPRSCRRRALPRRSRRGWLAVDEGAFLPAGCRGRPRLFCSTPGLRPTPTDCLSCYRRGQEPRRRIPTISVGDERCFAISVLPWSAARF
jgi:hypothetical protein